MIWVSNGILQIPSEPPLWPSGKEIMGGKMKLSEFSPKQGDSGAGRPESAIRIA
jgi:hypothetical protein